MSRFDTIVLATIAGLIAVTGGVIALGEHAGLGVVSRSPQDGSQPPATAAIRVAFSSPMDTASVEASFSLSPTIDGTTRWDGNTFIFTPEPAFVPGQTYTATFAPGAQSAAGRRLTHAQSWSFTPRAPSVLYLSPASGDAPGLWLLPDGGQPQKLYTAQYGVVDFAPSADGSQIAMTLLDKDQLSDIWLIDASGKNLRQITHCGPGLCGQPAWSPDGKLIAFERQEAPSGGKPGPSRIWLFDVASGSMSAVFEDQQVLGLSPVWSPDGSRLAFYDANVQAIQVLTLATGQQQQIPSSMGEVGSFAPDGSRMAYADIREVGPQFYPQVWMADLDPRWRTQPAARGCPGGPVAGMVAGWALGGVHQPASGPLAGLWQPDDAV